MTVKEIKPNTLCLEYRQEKGDKDYGSCLWARFMFNLDRYELTITSDCGNYGYKWCETPSSESFLHLMARCDWGYMLDKLYGSADIFDYEATKETFYKNYVYDELDKEKMDSIFEDVEEYGTPESAEAFLSKFESADYDDYFDHSDIWELVEYGYPGNALKIVHVFEDCIRPKIREGLKGGEEEEE